MIVLKIKLPREELHVLVFYQNNIPQEALDKAREASERHRKKLLEKSSVLDEYDYSEMARAFRESLEDSGFDAYNNSLVLEKDQEFQLSEKETVLCE